MQLDEEIIETIDLGEDLPLDFSNKLTQETRETARDSTTNNILNRLNDLGVSQHEIDILATLSEPLNKILDEVGDIKDLPKLSPVYQLRGKLKSARNELSYLKNRIINLEKSVEETTKIKKTILQLESKINQKQIIIKKQTETI